MEFLLPKMCYYVVNAFTAAAKVLTGWNPSWFLQRFKEQWG